MGHSTLTMVMVTRKFKLSFVGIQTRNKIRLHLSKSAVGGAGWKKGCKQRDRNWKSLGLTTKLCHLWLEHRLVIGRCWELSLKRSFRVNNCKAFNGILESKFNWTEKWNHEKLSWEVGVLGTDLAEVLKTNRKGAQPPNRLLPKSR